MYLQEVVEESIWSKYDELTTTFNPKEQVEILAPILAEFGVKFRLARSTSKAWLLKGFYDPNDDDILILMSRRLNQVDREFCFNLNCTVQHEMIHKYQWMFRDPHVHRPRRYQTQNGNQAYLGDFDEIDTQAHDLAMEVKYYYPGVDPNEVLTKYFHSYDVHLPTLNSYMKAFGSDLSHPVMKRLFRKLFLWLPLVVIRRPNIHVE